MNIRPAIQLWLPFTVEGEVFRDDTFSESPSEKTISTEPPWYVIRMPGGVGGGEPRGSSLSRLSLSKNPKNTGLGAFCGLQVPVFIAPENSKNAVFGLFRQSR